jgi:hypothetical protein
LSPAAKGANGNPRAQGGTVKGETISRWSGASLLGLWPAPEGRRRQA